MRETFRVGTVAGIPIGAHWSALALLLVVTNGLAGAGLPELVPGYSMGAYWLTAAVATVLLLGCVLLHELAHALLARRYGVPVERITLWALGGFSLLGGEPETPRAAFWISASGPLTSLGLGAFAGSAGLLLDAAHAPGLVTVSALWLAVMNVVLGLFNLLPGVPLDGGRVLRAALWHRYGDPDRAALAAARAGRVVGVLIAAGGVIEVVAGDPSGMWLVAVGYFVAIVAVTEGRAARLRSRAGKAPVAAVMSPPGVCGYALMSVERFLTEVAPRTGQRVFAVTDFDGRPTGTISLGRLSRVPPALRASTLLIDVRVPLRRVPVAKPGDPLADLLVRMPARPDALALVVEGERLVGVVTSYDAMRATAPPRPGELPRPGDQAATSTP